MSERAGEDLKQLWREFRKSQDKAIRDRLILTYAPLVKFVAGRLGSGLPAHVDENDLVSYGLLGLIGAIERYDPDRDVKFETYAITRIKGAIIDELLALRQPRDRLAERLLQLRLRKGRLGLGARRVLDRVDERDLVAAGG